MKAFLGGLTGAVLTFVLMSLTNPSSDSIPRYHASFTGNWTLVYDAVTGKVIKTELREIKNSGNLQEMLETTE